MTCIHPARALLPSDVPKMWCRRRRTEHEENMLAAKLKREAKAAKAAAFRARVEASNGLAPVSEVVPQSCRQGPGPHIVQAGRNVVQIVPEIQMTEEQRRAHVAALLHSRRQAFEQRHNQATRIAEFGTSEQTTARCLKSPDRAEMAPLAPCLGCNDSGSDREVDGEAEGMTEAEQLDRLFQDLVDRGVLSEAAIDRITDALALGEMTSQQCLHKWGGRPAVG